MNKLSFSSAVLAVSGFFISATQALAAISGEELTANLALADFLAIGSRWFNYLLAAFIVFIVIYGIYYFIKRKKK
ncbi:hypothetical protein KKE19_01165 [Patescibacteria group bacterium]|nr:hypothetical protein [Patescibacteria group bacterium]MBU4368018.1 hypothetical protein [Patescibacteria group bacterium]MBU4462253.1 hypothetical protein [Patescibacteria group bacterium]MCG2699609.1 hypothetical protein [Candidatus Parcubacteria bacterium]